MNERERALQLLRRIERESLYATLVLINETGFVRTLVLGVLRWRFTRYRITGDRVELHSGWIRRQRRSVPRDRIRTVDLTSRLEHRIFGLSVVFDLIAALLAITLLRSWHHAHVARSGPQSQEEVALPAPAPAA